MKASMRTTGALPWGIPQDRPSHDVSRIAPSGDCSGFIAQVLTPFAQAMLTGAFLGALGWGAWYALIDPAQARGVGIALGGLGAGAAWIVLMWDSRILLRLRETSFQPEGVEAKPPTERVVWVYGGDRPGVEAAQGKDAVPAQASTFGRFMAQALQGTSSLEKHFGRVYTQATREKLIAGGFASWKGRGRRAGWALTERGQALAERCAGR